MTLLNKISSYARDQLREMHEAIHAPISKQVDGYIQNYIGTSIIDKIKGVYELELDLKHSIIVKTRRYDFHEQKSI